MLSLFKYSLYKPSHFKAVCRDALRLKSRNTDLSASLHAAMDWLICAHDNGDGGVAGYFSLATGWNAPYPETTGYIIPTMFDYSRFSGQSKYRDRAIAMADWELGIQYQDGAFPGGYTDSSPGPIVFNTGQVLQGLVAAYVETQDERYRTAARKAGDWLAAVQDPNGAWTRHTYRNTFHTYHTRVAWPLLQLREITEDDRYAKTAINFLQWALENQQENGWFKHNALYLRTDYALTHSVAYAIRGFLESGVLLQNDEYLSAAKKASSVLLDKFEVTGNLQASYGSEWDSSDTYSCVTGNAQMSGIWLRLYTITKDPKYRAAAAKMNAALRGTQNLTSSNSGIRGGIKGSDPIYGRYMPFCYINWATKFFADTLMFEEASKRLDPVDSAQTV